MFLAGISTAAMMPAMGKAATLTKKVTPRKKAKHRVPISGKVLAAEWKVLASTKLAGQIPPGLSRQIYCCLAAAY